MLSDDRHASGAPLVSVVMANFEAGEKIVPALRSVMRQTMRDIEIIVSDDASRDDSVERVREQMVLDPRIRLVSAEGNGGPARSRNRALEAARGRWIAIVDSDDIIHHERLERLLAAAQHHAADIVADDLLLFYEDGTRPRLMLDGGPDQAHEVPVEQWVRAGVDGSPSLGYLKPLISAERLGSLRYDEALRIGEDYDLLLRLLLGGARMVVVPEPYYLYRRHTASTSHRLSVSDMEAMVGRQQALIAGQEEITPSLAAAFAARLASLQRGLAYERLVASIKAGRFGAALSEIKEDPSHLSRLWASFREGRRRRSMPEARHPSPVLVLGARGTPGVAHVVPGYTSVHATDWGAPRTRQIWLDLAARRGEGRVHCIALDEAGHYAAGFIPEAEIDFEILREAS